LEVKIEKIIRSRRTTIELYITDDARLIIRAPFSADEKTINHFIEKHKRWIDKKIKLIKEQRENFKEKRFVDGENFLYLGNNFKLNVVENKSKALLFDNGFYLSKDLSTCAKEIFEKCYKEKAKEIFTERAQYYSEIMNLKYSKIRIMSAKRRWASCSKKGNLNFNWRLVMAPLNIIDYVVVHELAHLIEYNHKKKFWEKVEKVLPDYKLRRKWLKDNGYLLKI